jgi:predicted phosphoribosyltransferase
MTPFPDRRAAGVELAAKLREYAGRSDVVVLGLPRGGVPVAYEIAAALDVPLDVFLVRKLGVPGHPELAMGAIASGGARVLNDDVVRWYGIPETVIDEAAQRETIELERRRREYQREQPPVELRGHTVVIVDDGLATGSTMKAAVQAIRDQGAARIVVAVPVGAPESCDELREVADQVVCARTPEHFSAVGQWYRDFAQTTDAEVRTLLSRASPRAG